MLSDSCCDAMIDLANAVINYADYGYSLDKMERVISGLFLIGSVASELDSEGWPTPPTSDEDRAWWARLYVLRALLDDESRQGDIKAALPTLSKIASLLPELRQAIRELYEWAQTPAAATEAIQGRFSASCIGPLYRMTFHSPAAAA